MNKIFYNIPFVIFILIMSVLIYKKDDCNTTDIKKYVTTVAPSLCKNVLDNNKLSICGEECLCHDEQFVSDNNLCSDYIKKNIKEVCGTQCTQEYIKENNLCSGNLLVANAKDLCDKYCLTHKVIPTNAIRGNTQLNLWVDTYDKKLIIINNVPMLNDENYEMDLYEYATVNLGTTSYTIATKNGGDIPNNVPTTLIPISKFVHDPLNYGDFVNIKIGNLYASDLNRRKGRLEASNTIGSNFKLIKHPYNATNTSIVTVDDSIFLQYYDGRYLTYERNMVNIYSLKYKIFLTDLNKARPFQVSLFS